MMLDSFDFFIIGQIADAKKKGEKENDWDMAKEYVKIISIETCQKIEDIDLNNIYKRIKHRLQIYSRKGWGEYLRESGNEEFFLDSSKIAVIKHRFSDGYKKCIILRFPTPILS